MIRSHYKHAKGLLTGDTLLAKFKRNGIANIYTQFITILIQFIQIPIYLKYWGSNLYSEWLVLTGITTMLSLLDLGVSQASTNKATIECGAGQWKAAQITLNTSNVFTLFVAFIAVISALLLNSTTNWCSVLNLTLIDLPESKSIIFLMAVYLGIQLQGGIISAVYRANGKSAQGMYITGSRRLIDLAITSVALPLGANITTFAILLVSIHFLYFLIVAFIISRPKWNHLYGIKAANLGNFLSIIKPSIAYMGIPLSQLATMQGTIQLLNAFNAQSLIVPFTMVRTMMRMIIQIAMVANNALKPEISLLIGAKKFIEAQTFTVKIAIVTTTLSCMVFFVFLAGGPYIIDIWSHGKVSADRAMLALIGIHALLNVVWYVLSAVQIAANKHVKLASVYAAATALSILCWVCLGNRIHPLFGACLVMTLPEIAMCIFFQKEWRSIFRTICNFQQIRKIATR